MNRIGLLGLVAAAAACSEPAMSIDAYSAAWLDIGCEYLVRCGVTPAIANCRATRAPLRYAPDRIAAVEAGLIQWHGDAAEDCLVRLEAASCDRTSESYRHLGCEPLFTGTLSDGQSCALHGECISGECWTESCTDACCIGYCVGNTPPAVAAIGEVCGISECEAGAWCENRLCVPLRGDGETCTYDECGYDLVCVDRVCRSPIDRGAQCTSNSQCCMLGDTCGPRGVCAPAGQFGEPCIFDDDCASHYVCDVYQQCAPAPRIGEHCDEFFFSECFDAGASCDPVTNMCSLPKPDGAQCTYPAECESYQCIAGVCLSCISD